jgi:hypothetical protein
MGATFKVTNGANVLFWEDVWVGDTPLKVQYPKLYDYSREKQCTVQECWRGGVNGLWNLRSLSLDEVEQWVDLVDLIQQVQLNEMADEVKWNFEKSGAYTTKSMYKFLLHSGVFNMQMEKVWKSKMRLKIKIFMWLTNHKRIQAGEFLGGDEMEGRD